MGGFAYISMSQSMIIRVIREIPLHVKFPTNVIKKTKIKEGNYNIFSQ